MDLGAILWRLSFVLAFHKMLAFGFVTPAPGPRCKFSRVSKLVKVRCFDMNLKEVPQNLATTVEILDLSYNRIKKLKRGSFQQYKSIKFLLLYENMIQSVEPGTFEHLKSLEEIDLSNNGLLTIPLEIFQLPSLRNLYVDSNELTHLQDDLEALETPIKAPLQYLNIADCGLEDLPDIGVLPTLWHINASSNPLTELNVERFAYMCQLTNVAMMYTQMDECACQQVNSHLRNLNIKMTYVQVCRENLDPKVCPSAFNRTVESAPFQQCKAIVVRAEATSRWLFIAGCLGGGLIVVLMVWLCINGQRKRRAKKLRSAQNRKQLVISPKNATNNNSHHRDDEPLNCDDNT